MCKILSEQAWRHGCCFAKPIRTAPTVQVWDLSKHWEDVSTSLRSAQHDNAGMCHAELVEASLARSGKAERSSAKKWKYFCFKSSATLQRLRPPPTASYFARDAKTLAKRATPHPPQAVPLLPRAKACYRRAMGFVGAGVAVQVLPAAKPIRPPIH